MDQGEQHDATTATAAATASQSITADSSGPPMTGIIRTDQQVSTSMRTSELLLPASADGLLLSVQM
jgi:hypothetical protein